MMSEKDVIAMKEGQTTETVHRADGSVAENLLDVSGVMGLKLSIIRTLSHVDEDPISLYCAVLLSLFLFIQCDLWSLSTQDIEPFTLAFLRWSLTGVILAMVSLRHWPRLSSAWRQNWRLFLALGWLGMWLAGGIVYMALRETTATNGLLIYTLPPALVILIEYFIGTTQSSA